MDYNNDQSRNASVNNLSTNTKNYNLLIFGIPESTSEVGEVRAQADKLEVTTLGAKMNILNDLQFITSFIRLGKYIPNETRARPLLLKCNCPKTKRSFFNASYYFKDLLKLNKIYFKEHLNQNELAANKVLRSNLNVLKLQATMLYCTKT